MQQSESGVNQQVTGLMLKLAWLGGVVDSEGWITLSRGYSGRNNGFCQYTPQLGLTNTSDLMIERVISILKECNVAHYVRRRIKPTGLGKKLKHDIICQGLKRATIAIHLVRPFLVVKAKLADLVLEFVAHRKLLRPKEHYGTVEHTIYNTIRAINNRKHPAGSSESIRETPATWQDEDVLRAARRRAETSSNDWFPEFRE